MPKRYFIELSYNGKPFHGWQIQENAITVQEVLNKALMTILREDINVVGAGRTDTGVHASYFMAHFDLTAKINDIPLLINKLNKVLPREIAVHDIKNVKDDAHTRFNALSRTYEYHITTVKNPFLHDFAWYYKIPLNVDKMNRAAKILFDFEDFTSFSKTGTQVATNNCKILFAEWNKRDEILVFKIKADRFLRNMVRAIVGTLVEVGQEKISIEDFRKIVELRDRGKAGFSVPPQGLFLTDIEYPKSLFEV
jgi:tRNA pseudouridine38-40 synthase